MEQTPLRIRSVSAHRAHHFQHHQTTNTKGIIRLGEPIRLAHEFIQSFIAQGGDGALLEGKIFNIVANPPAFFADELRVPLARAIYRPAFTPRDELAPWRQWGEGLEAEAVKQMAHACALRCLSLRAMRRLPFGVPTRVIAR